MKRLFLFALALIMALSLAACSRSAATTWREQYDLGVRYLSEGNYREAILAFNAAIEIDPKRAEAYIGLADAYEAQGDLEQARQVLADALAVVTDADAIRNRLNGLEENITTEPTPGTTVEPTQEPNPTPGPTPETTAEPAAAPTAEPTQGPAPTPAPTAGPTPTPTPTPMPSVIVIGSGDCGESVTWTLDSDGTLTISGTGPMRNYKVGAIPWYENFNSIKKVVIEDGVTSIGERAFWYGSSLTSVTIPSSIAIIEDGAFGNCSKLTDVYYGSSESQWNQIIINTMERNNINDIISYYSGNRYLRNSTIHYNSTGP